MSCLDEWADVLWLRHVAQGGEFKHETYSTVTGRLRTRLAVGSGGATCEPDLALMWNPVRHAAVYVCEGPLR